jgi:hypothetical protein
MSYSLRFDGINDRATFSSTISLDLASTYTFEFKGVVNDLPLSGAIGGILGRVGTSAGFAITPTGTLAGYTSGILRYQSPASFIIVGVRHTYRIEHDVGGALRFYRDGSLISSSTFTFSTVAAPLSVLGSSTNSAMFLSADVDYIEITGPANSQKWDASLSGGAGSTLPTTSGSNNATLINFPTDDSQWIFYDDGGAITSTTAFTMPQFTLAAALTDSEPASVSSTIAFTMPQFIPAASVTDTAPTLSAAIAVTMPQFALAASVADTVPIYNASAAFAMPQFALSAALIDTAPEFTASAAFAMPQFSLAAALSDTDTPLTTGAVSFTMPSFTVASAASVINPDKPLIGFWLSDKGIAGYRRGFNNY